MTILLRTIGGRAPLTIYRYTLAANGNSHARCLSSQHGAVSKLKSVFEEYRVANYAQTLPSRFKKEVICAVDKQNDGLVSLDDIDRLLINIGAADRISRDDLEFVLAEIGVKCTQSNKSKFIPVEKIVQLL